MPKEKRDNQVSQQEMKEWLDDPPDKYFAYIEKESSWNGFMTTWTGDRLGYVRFLRYWTSNFGDRRVSIYVRGTNGKEYYGTYYQDAGDYCRIKKYKNS